jgi:hypothetical protein
MVWFWKGIIMNHWKRNRDVRTEPAAVLPDHFYTMPHAAHTTMTSSELRSILLHNDGMVMAAGQLWEIRSTHLGVGVHRVWLALAEGFKNGESNAEGR